jgi:hypothetical protein
MCRWGTDATVRLAHPMPISGRTEIAVDACLAPLVQLLNDYGVHTTGCCCGHGRADGQVTYEGSGSLTHYPYEQNGRQYALTVNAPPSADASDPHAADPGNPPTRVP